MDIDGGCLARKWQHLSQAGSILQPLLLPEKPLTCWELLKEGSDQQLLSKLPSISHGTMYQYLSTGAGHDKTFRALYADYNHWASGRYERIECNVQNPYYSFVRAIVLPTMRQGVKYNVYLLIHHVPGGFGEIKTASCQCAAG